MIVESDGYRFDFTDAIDASCQVLNLAAWNRNFPKWPVQKLGD